MPKNEISTPTCLFCGERLLAQYREIRDHDPDLLYHQQPRFRVMIRGYGYRSSGYFCSRICGYDWAMDHLTNNADMNLKRSNQIVEANEARGFLPDGTIPFKKLQEIVRSMKYPEKVENNKYLPKDLRDKIKSIIINKFKGDQK